jgi:hypothetical protein
MMAAEYKKRGGSYNTTKEEGQSESQKHLDNWTKEEWQTKDGEGTARQDDGSRKRYLPKKAWEELSESEKKDTDEKKVKASKGGKQFVGNTGEAKGARRRASVGSRDGEKDEAGKDHKDRKAEVNEDEGDGSENAKDSKKKSKGTKRKAKQETTPNKKQKDSTRMQSLRKRE